MKYRKLRIAWSVVWGVVAVLLCVLWVRSYWRVEHFLWNSKAESFCVSIYPGQAAFESVNDAVMMPMGWSHVVFPVSGNDSTSDDEPRTVLGFGWQTDNDLITAYIPFWFLISAACCVTALPWVRSLPIRFSLHMLLIATALLATALGLIVYAVRK